MLELQHDRDYFAEKADYTRDPGDIFISDCIARRARIEVRKAKSNHCKIQVEILQQQQRKLWREIRHIDPEAPPEIQNLTDEATGKIIPQEKLPDSVNNYFVDIGELLAKKFQNLVAINEKEDEEGVRMNNHHFELVDATTQDVLL